MVVRIAGDVIESGLEGVFRVNMIYYMYHKQKGAELQHIRKFGYKMMHPLTSPV
jgi:hypothetical protein